MARQPTDDLLTPAQLREKLGISQPTYFRWLREGRLKGVLVGGRRRFSPDDIQNLQQDPDQAGRLRAALSKAAEACAERLVKAGLKKKEIEAMRHAAKTEPDGIVNMLLAHALRKGASDLHLEPVADGLAVRERIHGILRRSDKPIAAAAQQAVIQSIKKMAGLHVTETRTQDARFFADYEGRKIDVYCTTYDTALGESVCLRLLDPARVTLAFGRAGFSQPIQQAVRAAALKPGRGVFIVNGPTGCGKTTTIYSLLSELNNPNVKIMTIEDPVEFRIDGVLQQPLREPFKFATPMKAMLRSDVDIGFVGEMRDQESTLLLFQMATTGHKMFTTLHAPDAVTALSRLIEFGKVPPQLLADCTLGILNQRLAPKSCARCRAMEPISADEAAQLGVRADFKVARNAGCDECDGTGVLGRTAVGELLTISPPLRKALLAGATAAEDLRKALPADHRDLRTDVLDRLRAGDFSVESALRALD